MTICKYWKSFLPCAIVVAWQHYSTGRKIDEQVRVDSNTAFFRRK